MANVKRDDSLRSVDVIVSPDEDTSLLMSPVGSDQYQSLSTGDNGNDVEVHEESEKRSVKTGLTMVGVSALLFSVMSLLVKIGSINDERFPFGYSSSQLVFARSVVQFVISLIWLLVIKVNPFGPPSQPIKSLKMLYNSPRFNLFIRGFSGSIGLAMFYLSITLLPLADATTLFFTGPPMTALLAHLWLGEDYTRLDIISSFICLVGVVLVSRPSFLFGSHLIDDTTASPYRASGVFAALFGACMSAVAYCSVRRVTRLAPGQVHPLVHVFYFGLISTVISIVILIADASNSRTPSGWIDVLLLSAIGISAFFAQFLLNNGLQKAPAGPAVLLRNLDVIFAFLGGVFVLQDAPTDALILGLDITGAVLICLGAAFKNIFKLTQGLLSQYRS
ncbi:hypothetical protein MP228_010155 [Amoeboaphelidium protococcarum]|nr:hypothetical protein MP228_010155 [Amoeboaphelidium protococcarum]